METSQEIFSGNISLCLQVKQDLGFKGGGVRVGDCQAYLLCFYQYLLNHFTNIQIRSAGEIYSANCIPVSVIAFQSYNKQK